MSYLEDFKVQIHNHDFAKFLQLWEEYCTSETIDSEELKQVFEVLKDSEFAKPFSHYIETTLPLWQMVADEKASYEILRLIIDLQTTNTDLLAEKALHAIKQRYGNQPNFNERIRLVGLRNKENFQGAISKYDLLAHMEKGKFVYHSGGWGTGEIVDVSPVREQLIVEFENVGGRKDLSFANAFKTLIPLDDQHFLARRFANPDLLEKEAKENPVEVIRMLLRDLGSKTAAEIKDELCELVIPEKDWTKWWQGVRAKLKKDTKIETPLNLKDKFRMRKAEVSHEERIHKAIQDKTDIDEIIQTSYNFIRDFSNTLKNPQVKESLKEKLLTLLILPELTHFQRLQATFLLESQFAHKVPGSTIAEMIQNISNFEEAISAIEILALKKRVLVAIREYRKDWVEIFLSLLFSLQQSPLRDYILKELNQSNTSAILLKKFQELLDNPTQYPEMFVWYFQKLVSGDEGIPFCDKEGHCLFLEAFLILFSSLETKAEYRDLLKKMYTILSGKRYAVVRAIIQGTSIEFIKEFLLLVSKCQTLSDHDIKILRSLAEVVHPSLSLRKTNPKVDSHVIWTTEEGYFKTQERIRQIGTIEIIENAREIEAARALGDLRENSEYKFALEKRSRLQAELKMLSEQLNRARIITKDDIPAEEVGIGMCVDVRDTQGKKTTYTILGPWDANPEINILSFQSKFVQAMIGCKEGGIFEFRNERFTVLGFRSFFDK